MSTEQVTDSSSAQPATNPQTSSDPQTSGKIKKLLKLPSTVSRCAMYKKMKYYIDSVRFFQSRKPHFMTTISCFELNDNSTTTVFLSLLFFLSKKCMDATEEIEDGWVVPNVSHETSLRLIMS